MGQNAIPSECASPVSHLAVTIGEELIDVVEHGDVPPGRVAHGVDARAPGLPQEEDAEELGQGAVPREDARLEVGVPLDTLRGRVSPVVVVHLLRGQGVEHREVLVAEGGDYVVQQAEEAVLPVRERLQRELPLGRAAELLDGRMR